MSHRIFIAINLPEDIKRNFVEIQQKWADLPVRWTKKASLHITLVFLGYMSDEELYQVCEITKKVARLHQPFFINFKKVLFGPPGKSPRMIWVEGACPELVEGKNIDKLSYLKQDLENSLTSAKLEYKPENFTPYRNRVSGAGRGFSPHITLARIRMQEWRDLRQSPKIEENISLSFSVNSIEIMESQLLRGGAEYTVLESAPLG